MIEEKPSEAKQVKIVLRRGDWEVEVACAEDRVQQVVESVLAGLAPHITSSTTITREIKERTPQKRTATIRVLIEQLWRENWFTEPRSLAEVDLEIGRRGYHYDRSAISHSLTDLTREGVLTRTGLPRVFRYLQKRPPPK